MTESVLRIVESQPGSTEYATLSLVPRPRVHVHSASGNETPHSPLRHVWISRSKLPLWDGRTAGTAALPSPSGLWRSPLPHSGLYQRESHVTVT